MKTESSEKWIVCRVCLNNPSDGEDLLQDIFSSSAAARLDQMLHICAGIPVSIDDNFPDKMCSKCVRCLRLAYKFRMTCQRSHQHIADMLASVTDAQAGADATTNVEEYSTETILWEDELDVDKPVKVEEQPEEEVRYIISHAADDDEVIYDEFVEETEGDVIYESAQTVGEQTETYAEYEELEVLATELPSTTCSRSSHIVGAEPSESADDDVANDILSSDDEQYLTERKAKPRLLNRARQVRQSKKPLAKTGATLIDEHGKKMGRKPRDKNSNYICDVCGNIYPTQARLTEHMKFHSGVKPHECEICGRGFVQNQQLVRHMNTHTGNRPYKCNFCPAAFADRSTKTKHHRIHTKERPYECDVCFKTFTYSDNLKFHKMIHTGEKPHVCDICGKGFVKAYKMRLHRVTHEKRGWKPVDGEGQDLHESVLG